jgi:hypothetical protein
MNQLRVKGGGIFHGQKEIVGVCLCAYFDVCYDSMFQQ